LLILETKPALDFSCVDQSTTKWFVWRELTIFQQIRAYTQNYLRRENTVWGR
jgi:hypothetical protein